MAARLGDTRLPHLPALDGVRALAVVAVLLYHADISWIPGGFLGVEVFFVLSGYLITALLWNEWRAHGTIGLRRFWLRRARRLLPALFALLFVLTAVLLLGWPVEAARIRAELLAALGYVSNWHLIVVDRPYFETLGRPSPLQHLWSLAVEEQFYLVWPVVLSVLAVRMRRALPVARVVGLAALASAVAAWVLYTTDGDPSRVYYGTDTRAAGLLIGAALALLWRPFERSAAAGPHVKRTLDAVAAGAALFLVSGFLRFDEFSAFTYRPGIQLVAIATALLIASSIHPASGLGSRIFGDARVTAVGRRAYSIYLWHWPVFVLTRPEIDIPWPAPAVFALRVVLTAVLAEASFRFVEEPVRNGALERAFGRVRAHAARSPQHRQRIVASWGIVGVVVVLAIGLLGTAVAHAPTLRPDEVLAVDDDRTARPVPSSPGSSPIARPARDRTPEQPPGVTPVTTRPRRAAPGRPAAVVAVGDSVMLGARAVLKQALPGAIVDTAIGRQVSDGLAALRELRARGRIGDVVVVHFGNNGPFRSEQFDEMMQILRGVSRVVVVDVRIPRRWEQQVNKTLAAGVKRHPGVRLASWSKHSRTCGGRLFAGDGVHLTPTGAACYATLIATSVA